MNKFFKQAVKITNDNIIVAIPLILFMWLITAYVGYSKWTADTAAELFLAVVTMLFMFGAFLSGWFYMVKKAVLLSKEVFVLDSDRAKATFNLVKLIPAGIGKYFLSFIAVAIMSMIIFSFFGAAVYKLGAMLIGNLDLNPLQVKQAMISPQDMKLFLDSLNEQQLIRLSNWNLLLILGSSILSFLLMFWIPEIMFCRKNAFIALFTSIKKIFMKFFNSIKLFLFLMLLNFTLSFISTFALYNAFLYLVMMIAYFYFLVYMVVLLFTYYESEYCEKE